MNYDGPLSGILLLSDIDGTLLPENGEIPENNISAIEKFKTLGGTFGLCILEPETDFVRGVRWNRRDGPFQTGI